MHADELSVVVATPNLLHAQRVVEAIRLGAEAALERATRTALLVRLHEFRQHEPRLLPGGAFALRVQSQTRLELHERLLGDRQRALRVLRDALQPFALAGIGVAARGGATTSGCSAWTLARSAPRSELAVLPTRESESDVVRGSLTPTRRSPTQKSSSPMPSGGGTGSRKFSRPWSRRRCTGGVHGGKVGV